MDMLLAGAGGVGAFGAGWFAGAWQHLLYRQAQYRSDRAGGRKALVIRVTLGLSSALAALIALRPGHYAVGPALLTAAFAVALLVLASTDFERRLIPNRLLYPALLGALAFSWAWPDRDVVAILQGTAFAAAAGVVIFALGAVAGGAAGGLGLGDSKLMILIGALAGWPAVMPALFMGVIFAGVPALALLVSGHRRTRYSYGPYLVLAALVVLLFPGSFV